jgi:hypothetical protein
VSESLLAVFQRIRSEDGPAAVPVRLDPGDVRARVGRARTRRRLVVAVCTTGLVGIGGTLVALALPGAGTVDVVPAAPVAPSTVAVTDAPTPSLTHAVISTPYGPYKDLPAPGALLDAEEVGIGQPGVGWTEMPTEQPDQVDGVGMSDCIGSGSSHDGIDGLGHGRSFSASVPGGKLFVWETVLRMDAGQTRRAAQYVRGLAPCAKPSTREVVLSRSAAGLLTGTRLQSTGALTSASATIVENDQLIVITVDGDPTDIVSVPGGLTWLKALTDRAVAHAAG